MNSDTQSAEVSEVYEFLSFREKQLPCLSSCRPDKQAGKVSRQRNSWTESRRVSTHLGRFNNSFLCLGSLFRFVLTHWQTARHTHPSTQPPASASASASASLAAACRAPRLEQLNRAAADTGPPPGERRGAGRGSFVLTSPECGEQPENLIWETAPAAVSPRRMICLPGHTNTRYEP